MAALVAASGCDAILGIKDVSLDPKGSSSTSSGTGGSTSSSSSGGGGGTGGVMQGDFSLVIGAVSVNLPYDGHALVNVEIVPSGGFVGAVDVAAEATVAGLEVQGTQIPMGSTKGVINVGATSPLTIGQMLTLKLKGTSDKLLHTAEVPATVTGKPGTLDEAFMTDGVTLWPAGNYGGSLSSIQLAQSNILVSGSTESIQSTMMFGVRILGGGGLDAAFNAAGTPPGKVQPVFCGCGGLLPEQARGAFRFASDEVVVVGTAPRTDKTQYDITIARFKDDGTPKVFNGDGGLRRIDTGDNVTEGVAAVALTSAPQLLVLGDMTVSGNGYTFLAKINSANTGLDPAFGQNGRLTWIDRTPVTVLLDGMSRVIVVSTQNGNWRVERLLANGSLDAQVEQPFGASGFPIAAAALKNNGIILLTYVPISGDSGFGLWHLNPDLTVADLGGRPNPEVYDPTVGGADEPSALAVLPDGRILVAGTHASAGSFLARILPDGTPDPLFGDGAGWVDVSLGPATQLQVMTTTADGKVLLGGTAGTPANFAVGRVWN